MRISKQLQNKTQYELLLLYKTTDNHCIKQVIEYILYLKYKNSIKKKAASFLNTLSQDRSVEIDDIVSFCTETFLTTLSKLDYTKVKDKNNFTVGPLLQRRLTGYLLEWEKQQKPTSRCISMSEFYGCFASNYCDNNSEQAQQRVLDAIENFKYRSSDTTIKVMNLWMQGFKSGCIQKKLGITHLASVSYYKKVILLGIHKELQALIKKIE